MTIDQLQDFLNNDLSWRKAEISQLFRIHNDVENKSVLLKTIILLLYAHWEGYIKKSSKYYLKYVIEKKVKIKNLTINFKAIALKDVAKRCIKNDSLTLSNELFFINKQNNMDEKKFKIKIDIDDDQDKSLINTKDNLSSKVLNNIINIIGMKYNDAMKMRSNYIDYDLVYSRNSIGHGNKLIHGKVEKENDLSYLDVVKLKDFIMIILDYFSNMLIDYAEKELYLSSKDKERNEYELLMEKNLKNELELIDKKYTNSVNYI